MLRPQEAELVVGGQVGCLFVVVNNCAQRRNQRREMRFSDLYLSIFPLSLFIKTGEKKNPQIRKGWQQAAVWNCIGGVK